MDSVRRPGIDTSFSPSTFDEFQMGSTAANPIKVDDEEDKENSAPTTTITSEFERPTEPPRLLEVVHSRLDKKICMTPYTGLSSAKFYMCLYLIHSMCFINTRN